MQSVAVNDDPKVRRTFGPKIAMAITQRNALMLIETLPAVVESIEEQFKAQEAAKAAFVESQKGVSS